MSRAASEGRKGIFQRSEGGFPALVNLHTRAADQTASQKNALSRKASY